MSQQRFQSHRTSGITHQLQQRNTAKFADHQATTADIAFKNQLTNNPKNATNNIKKFSFERQNATHCRRRANRRLHDHSELPINTTLC